MPAVPTLDGDGATPAPTLAPAVPLPPAVDPWVALVAAAEDLLPNSLREKGGNVSLAKTKVQAARATIEKSDVDQVPFSCCLYIFPLPMWTHTPPPPPSTLTDIDKCGFTWAAQGRT
jgi:hypothetical protein